MTKPLISIITPCYNSEQYIGRYLESILCQTYSRLQLVLVNDGSTDATEEVIFSYKEALEKKGIIFTYIIQENKGLGGAVNNGLKIIKGDYFTWCDSDNFFTSDFAEKCVDYLIEHPDCAILRHDGYRVSEKDLSNPVGRLSDRSNDKYNPHLFENAIFEKNFHFGCAILKTSAFDKVNQSREIYESRQGQNWQLLLPMFLNYNAHYIDEPLFYFVFRENSVSNMTRNQTIEKRFEQLDEYENILITTIENLNVDQDDYKKRIHIKYIRRKLRLAVTHGNLECAKKYYSELRDLNSLKVLEMWKYRAILSLARNQAAICFARSLYRRLVRLFR